MKISVEWLKEKEACPEAVVAFTGQKETDSVKIILRMIRQEKYLDWGNWLIVRTMTRPQYIAYAIFAAEQVIDIFEKKYPNDKRPRLAIEAAKAVLTTDTKETRAAAWAARDAAWALGEAAGTAAGAAGAAAGDAAWAAAWDAGDAAGAAWDAAWDAAWAAARAAAWDAAWAAGAAGAAARKEMQTRIIRYGLSLIKEPTP